MSTKVIVLLLIVCLFTDVCSKFVDMVDRPAEVEPDGQYDGEEDRKICFCCRAFVCRHQLCPCSRFTALF